MRIYNINPPIVYNGINVRESVINPKNIPSHIEKHIGQVINLTKKQL